MQNKNLVGILVSFVTVIMGMLAFVVAIYALFSTNTRVTTWPDKNVQDFFIWYLSYEENPLRNQAYHSNKHLSPELIAFLDGFTQDDMRYDPLLCAQEKTTEIHAFPAQVSENVAIVEVATSISDHRLSVELVQRNGDWLINKVICAQ